MTYYSNGEKEISNKMTFKVDENAAVNGIDMKDQLICVQMGKRKVAEEKELPGARLAVLNEQGEVMEEWTSSEQLYTLKAKLNPEETYFFTELMPPEGFAYAKKIPFTVLEEGGAQIIFMEDTETQVEIVKTDSNGEKRLQGAELAVKDNEQHIIEHWISQNEPHRINGKLKAGELYFLHEISAPDGYKKAKSVPFSVSKNGKLDRVTMKDFPTRIRIEKRGYSENSQQQETEKELLGGALIIIRNMHGKEVYQFYTEEGKIHEITGVLKAGERYIVEEQVAPEGYELTEPVIFTVPDDDDVVTVCMVDRKKEKKPDRDIKEYPEIKIRKYDAITMEGIEGAEFAVYNSDETCYTTIRTGTGGIATFPNPGPGVYNIKEIKAPDGYVKSDQTYSFNISRTGCVSGETDIPNSPILTGKENRKVGWVTAFYEEEIWGKGKNGFPLKLPKLGDHRHFLMEIGAYFLALFGCVYFSKKWFFRRKRKHKKEEGVNRKK